MHIVCVLKQADEQSAGVESQAAAGQGGGAANGDAGWSWLDAFEARQKALAAQAAGESSNRFFTLYRHFASTVLQTGHD